jgi:hypothetical protein
MNHDKSRTVARLLLLGAAVCGIGVLILDFFLLFMPLNWAANLALAIVLIVIAALVIAE